jgi:hypothetical protein
MASTDNFPRKCYNGPKAFQAGWYIPFQVQVSLPIGATYNWDGNLVGFAEASSASATDKMIIRITSGSKDIYIHFNRQVGMNSDVPTNGNKVLVNSRSGTSSSLLAALSALEDYQIVDFYGIGSGKTLTITLLDIIQGPAPAPWRAKISVELS